MANSAGTALRTRRPPPRPVELEAVTQIRGCVVEVLDLGSHHSLSSVVLNMFLLLMRMIVYIPQTIAGSLSFSRS